MLSPLESAEGILVTAAIRDISVRKAAEAHLAQMEARYRGLLEAAPDAMVVVDQAGEIVLLNLQAEKQFGYQRDELVGQQVTNIIPEGFAERLIADDLRSAADALAQQIGTGIELVRPAQGRHRVPDRDHAQPARERRGHPRHRRRSATSATRKAAENQLLQAQKLESIGRLAGGIAHDFNNMLFAIHGYAELLTAGPGRREPRRTRSGRAPCAASRRSASRRAGRRPDGAAAGLQPPADRHREGRSTSTRRVTRDRADAPPADRREHPARPRSSTPPPATSAPTPASSTRS